MIVGRLIPINIEKLLELRIGNDQEHTLYNIYKDYT
jgi:hypothetical protein